ncbi:MAG TPA: general secretion pathway protein GspB [Steroidobacteraceae bacterium]|nr:general secretion pathway protein GspB [Steroidobacteraceae bacterium]
MSFILDALKKSEVERQRQTVPGLMDAGRVPPRPRFPPWAAALGVLLGVNVIVLLGLLLRHESAAPAPGAGPVSAPAGARSAAPAARATPANRTELPPATSPAAQTANHFSPMEGTPTYAPEIPLAAADAASVPAPVEERPQLRRAPSSPAIQLPEEPDEVLPTLSELNLTGPDALPELHLDVHVWATIGADRFVYINSRKYREGAHLQEGPTLERIRRDGVVLNSQGIRFLLPRDQ